MGDIERGGDDARVDEKNHPHPMSPAKIDVLREVFIQLRERDQEEVLEKMRSIIGGR
jgi:hypothetical protein